MRTTNKLPNPSRAQQNSRTNLRIEQTNNERKSKNKTSLEDTTNGRMVQTSQKCYFLSQVASITSNNTATNFMTDFTYLYI